MKSKYNVDVDKVEMEIGRCRFSKKSLNGLYIIEDSDGFHVVVESDNTIAKWCEDLSGMEAPHVNK